MTDHLKDTTVEPFILLEENELPTINADSWLSIDWEDRGGPCYNPCW